MSHSSAIYSLPRALATSMLVLLSACSEAGVFRFRRTALLVEASSAAGTELPEPVLNDTVVLNAIRGRDHMTLTLKRELTGNEVIQQYGLTMIGDAGEVISRSTGNDLDRPLAQGQKLRYRLTLKGNP